MKSLHADVPVLSVELRPPRAELDAAAGMDAWIDTHHAVRGFVRNQSFVFLTDSAVGTREEHTLRHLVINLGADVPRDRVVPFLTTKHSLDFCLSYAERAWQEGFPSLFVLGGDKSLGPPRLVEHAWLLRGKSSTCRLARRLGQPHEAGQQVPTSPTNVHRRVLPDAGGVAPRRRRSIGSSPNSTAADWLPGV